MKQAKKAKAEPKKQEMTVVKGIKHIPFKKLEDGFDTGKLINLVLSYNPKLVDPTSTEAQHWGLTISEMLDRQAIREKINALNENSTVLELTESQAKHLCDMCFIIKWGAENTHILDFWNSLK